MTLFREEVIKIKEIVHRRHNIVRAVVFVRVLFSVYITPQVSCALTGWVLKCFINAYSLAFRRTQKGDSNSFEHIYIPFLTQLRG